MKFKILILFGCLFSLLYCGLSEQARQVQMYRDNLSAMIEKIDQDVDKQLVDSWHFELLNIWETNDPNVETVIKNNYRDYGFSRKEAESLFASKGRYKVEIYIKTLGSEMVSTGGITAGGQTNPGMQEKRVTTDFALIRVVFRDKKLIQARIW
jgi:hypothetical protein